MTKYIALFRGINSGKNPATKMVDLSELFANLGCKNVTTIIASGNVVFETDIERAELTAKIETEFEKKFKFHSSVTLRNKNELQKLIDSNPFAEVTETKETRTYITFLKNPSQINSMPDGKGYRFLKVTETEVVSVIDLAETKTPDLMSVLDKTFGKDVTTRSWNTILKIAKKMQ